MPFGKKIVLHTPLGRTPRLDDLVAEFIRDGVNFIAVVGKDCALIEDIVDELVIIHNMDQSTDRFMLTSSHSDESLAEAIEYARILTDEYAGEPEIVELI